MIGRRRLTGSVATALLAAVLLSACSGQNQSDDDGLATFSSMDDVADELNGEYSAVGS
ncbi:hypothetical protein P4U43_16310 [Arthrobacter sp. EH-1B-1]|uniref:Uncharacterized protein n=1 Tax=Arthrobacter vasquezii TaxID=2977629 RepID=A0ABT6CZC7_9MICC|nr:hypothetical protein [Arthrobacter vasquezii]MDF9279354.1 hypothetical protein [Arthrobacter vasquezii]